MGVAIRAAAFGVLLVTGAACKTRPLVADAAGGRAGTVNGTDAGGAVDAATSRDMAASTDAVSPSDARRDLVAIDSAEYLACVADGDCVATYYPQPVTSAADCYCRSCALLAVNKATDANFAAQWGQYCEAWSSTTVCPIHPCPAPPTLKCVAGRCREGSRMVPASCPLDATSGCAGAVACGGGCCKPGEWCDEQIGCRCGYGVACPVGQTCGHAFAGNDGKGFCGDVCCFDCPP